MSINVDYLATDYTCKQSMSTIQFYMTVSTCSRSRLYEKVRYDGRVVSMAIRIVCGTAEDGRRGIQVIEPMLEEAEESYQIFFQSLRERGLITPNAVII